MAESTLSLTYDQLVILMGRNLGFGITPSGDELVQIQEYMASGLRAFYAAHNWSFLRILASLTLWAAISETSGVTISGSGTTITCTGATPFVDSMVGATISCDTGDFVIASVTSSTVVVATASAAAVSAEAFSMTPTGAYRLPADFGGLDGDPTFDPSESLGAARIKVMNEQYLRDQLANDDITGTPMWCAPRPLSNSAGAGQRFDLLVSPIPDANRVIDYRYNVLPGALSTGLYPYGGMQHAEALKAACLAQCELYGDDKLGIHNQNYRSQLADSIRRDIEVARDEQYGYNGDARETSIDYGGHRSPWIVTRE